MSQADIHFFKYEEPVKSRLKAAKAYKNSARKEFLLDCQSRLENLGPLIGKIDVVVTVPPNNPIQGETLPWALGTMIHEKLGRPGLIHLRSLLKLSTKKRGKSTVSERRGPELENVFFAFQSGGSILPKISSPTAALGRVCPEREVLRVLLVDDVATTGQTLKIFEQRLHSWARAAGREIRVQTFAAACPPTRF